MICFQGLKRWLDYTIISFTGIISAPRMLVIISSCQFQMHCVFPAVTDLETSILLYSCEPLSTSFYHYEHQSPVYERKVTGHESFLSVGMGFKQSTRLMDVCSVAQSCASLYDSMDGSPPSSSVHGILQARILGQGGVYFLLQGIFLTQGWTPHLLHLFMDSLPLAPPGKLIYAPELSCP